MIWYEFDSFRFEAETRILKKGDQQVALALKASDLLLLFLENPEKLFTKSELKREAWPDSTFVGDNNLFYQLSVLRDSLGSRPNGERYIETLPKRGYRFVAPVRKHCSDQDSIQASPVMLVSTTAESLPATVEPPSVHSFQRARLPIQRWLPYAILLSASLFALITAVAYRLTPVHYLRVARYVPLTHDGLVKQEGLLFTDGVRVYFGEKDENGAKLATVSVSGGGTGSITLPAGYRNIYDLSPLTSEFLAGPFAPESQGGELWVVSEFGGLRRRVGDLRADYATWSPDRQLIAFALNNSLYVANSDGTDRHKIAQVSGTIDLPRWAPDSKKLRFTEYRPLDDDVWETIWEVGTDGSHLHRLLAGWHNPPHECCGVWTPDGNFYIFQSTHNGRTDLWALSERQYPFRSNLSTPVLLSSGLQGYSSPTIGTDGNEVFAIGTEKRGELVTYDSKYREFVPYLGGIPATWTSFSKSGHSLAYISYPDLAVWRANRDGTEKTQITFPPFEADGLSWSPDEKWLALRIRTPGKPWKICLLSSNGGQPKELVPGDTEQAIPTWSADGRRIAFGDVPRIHGHPSGKQAIHILDLSNHTVSELPGSQGLWTARWSPDGHYLSALTIEGQRLMLYDFQSNQWRTTKAEFVNNPNWSHDSKYIYFDTEGHHRSLRRICIADGRLDNLTDLEGYPDLAWWWSGVSPDNTPLILRNIGSTEIYSLILEVR